MTSGWWRSDSGIPLQKIACLRCPDVTVMCIIDGYGDQSTVNNNVSCRLITISRLVAIR